MYISMNMHCIVHASLEGGGAVAVVVNIDDPYEAEPPLPAVLPGPGN